MRWARSTLPYPSSSMLTLIVSLATALVAIAADVVTRLLCHVHGSGAASQHSGIDVHPVFIELH